MHVLEECPGCIPSYCSGDLSGRSIQASWEGTFARLGKEQNFKLECASDSPVKIFKNPRPSESGFPAVRPKYFLNDHLDDSDEQPSLWTTDWRKYWFSINKTQRISLSFLAPWSNGKSTRLGSNLGLSSANVKCHLIYFIFVSQLLNGDSDTFCPKLLWVLKEMKHHTIGADL